LVPLNRRIEPLAFFQVWGSKGEIMLRPQHEIAKVQTAPSSSRVAGFLIAGLLNVAFVYVLTSGLAMKIIRSIPHTLEISVVTTPEKPQPTIAPPQPQTVQPPDNLATVTPPDIQIQTETPPQSVTATTAPATPTPDSAAAGVSSTHTIPPYPAEAKRLGEQGTVLLRLTISPSGDVIAADIVQSSGYADLDQTAAAWVQAHWKYKPAVQGGTAVQATTNAAVKFDLRKG
jgi:protein TonB